MLLLTEFNPIPSFDRPCGLTLGNFDGVHLGHQALLQHLKAKLLPDEPLVVITFSNHPSHLFNLRSPDLLIYSPLQKVYYLSKLGVDVVFLFPFDVQFAQISYDNFLKTLKRHLPFKYFCLGSGATFGKNREGNEANVNRLAKKLHFEVDYLQKYLINGLPVSSGRIRTLITQGNLLEAQECLGRPYSLMGTFKKEKDHYYLCFPGICLPPDGTYQVRLKTSSQIWTCQSNTMQKEQKIYLDISENRIPLVGKNVEIIFD